MKKYNDILMLKIGIFISCIFVVAVLIVASDIRLKLPDIHMDKMTQKIDIIKKKNKNKNKEQIETSEWELQDRLIVTADIIDVTQGRLIINLPGGVREENTTIVKDLLHKSLKITFPKGVGDYDYSKNENNTEFIKSIDYKLSNSMVMVDISLNRVMDCIPCFDNGQLFVDFFLPADTGMPVVVIDPGHGGSDVGAIQDDIYEKDINLQICLELEELLKDENILVYYTRQDDSYPSVEERVDFANDIMPELFISIHSNWYENASSSGTSVLYNVKDESEFSSMWFSEIMCRELVSSCGTYNRGLVEGNDIHIVRHSNAPVALLEIGFMSNNSDFELLTTETGQKKIAQGIYNGIIKALTEMGKY